MESAFDESSYNQLLLTLCVPAVQRDTNNCDTTPLSSTLYRPIWPEVQIAGDHVIQFTNLRGYVKFYVGFSSHEYVYDISK